MAAMKVMKAAGENDCGQWHPRRIDYVAENGVIREISSQ